MKILFTARGEDWSCKMNERFGRSDLFVLFNENTNELKSISNHGVDIMEHGAGLQTAKKMLDIAPDIIITGNGAGNKALEILQKTDIKMYIGAGEMTLKEAYEAYKNDELKLQY